MSSQIEASRAEWDAKPNASKLIDVKAALREMMDAARANDTLRDDEFVMSDATHRNVAKLFAGPKARTTRVSAKGISRADREDFYGAY